MQPCAMILFTKIFAIMLIKVPTPTYSDNNVETDFSNVVVMGNGTTLLALEFDKGYFEPLISLKEHENCALFDVHLDKTVFWCDTENSVIKPLSTGYPIISYPMRWQPKDFKVDFVSNKFYIIDGEVNSINIIDIYTGFYGIVISDLENPSNLILVPSKGIMFVALQSNCILKGNMDGTSLSVLRRTIGISTMAADYQTQTIYWVDEFLTINLIDFSGIRVDTLILAPTKVHGMTVFSQKLYWFSDSTLQILDLKSKPRKTKAVIETSHNYTKLASTSWTREVIRNPCEVDNGGCEHLCLLVPGANASLAKRCACKIGYEMKSYSNKCTHVNEFLLYTEGEFFRGKILDGSSSEIFTDAIMPKKFYTESLVSKDSIHFDYNLRKNKIYFSDDSNIWMIDIRGDKPQVKLLHSQADYLIFDVGFDWMTNILYFYEKNGDDYYLSMLGLVRGPKYKQYAIFEHFDKNPVPHGLVIHPRQMSFYQLRRSGHGEMSLHKDYLAGFSPIETIDTFKYKGKFVGELIAIDYDKLKVYWMKLGSLIYLANIDGKSKSKIKLAVPVWYPKSVSVYDEWIFVSNLTDVWRFDKRTGDEAKRLIRVSNVEDNLSAIRVLSPEVQVLDEDHPCVYMNGGCQHFCYATPKRHCDCMRGYQLVNEFRCSRRLKSN